MTVPVATANPKLKARLRRVKLGRSLATLPEPSLSDPLPPARSRQLGHAEFMELVLSDEVTRSDLASGEVRPGQPRPNGPVGSLTHGLRLPDRMRSPWLKRSRPRNSVTSASMAVCINVSIAVPRGAPPLPEPRPVRAQSRIGRLSQRGHARSVLLVWTRA